MEPQKLKPQSHGSSTERGAGIQQQALGPSVSKRMGRGFNDSPLIKLLALAVVAGSGVFFAITFHATFIMSRAWRTDCESSARALHCWC